MKNLMTFLASATMAFTASAGNLILVGDSTLAPRTPDVKLASWGDSTTNQLADGWQIVNVALGGRTVKTIQNGKVSAWQKAQNAMQPGDFVIVQFGINDANPKKLVEVPEFKSELAKFADVIRAKGATPVFCSPLVSGKYDKKTGTFKGLRLKYSAATREIAEEKKVDFVDMNSLTGKELAAMGCEAAHGLFVGKSTDKKGKEIFDTTHPNKQGAKLFGEVFIKEVKSRKLPIASIFK